MLEIRDYQIRALEQLKFDRFVREMEAHLRQHFRPQVEVFSAEELTGKIRAALARASALRIDGRGDLARFLNLCVAAGWDFLDDPNCATLARALSADLASHPSTRVDEACRILQQRLEEEAAAAQVWERFHALARGQESM